MYQAASIDGAQKFKQVWHISLPGIMPTIIIMLILRIGSFMNINYQKILLMYSPSTYETADVITSYVYRVSLSEGSDFSFGAAIGLFNSVVNLIMVVAANVVSRRFTETSLW